MMSPAPSPSRPWIKVCGVRFFADLEACAAAGATHVGINTWPGSPRSVPTGTAEALVGQARRLGLSPVLLHVPGSALSLDAAISLHPDFVQMRRKPTATQAASLAREGIALIESRPAVAESIAAASWGAVLLLDTPLTESEGGSGRIFDWNLGAGAARPFVLAGGLGPENVGVAIASARPAGVDAASALESSPGVKDPSRISAFCAAARTAFLEMAHAV